MKKISRRILSSLLAVVMILTEIPFIGINFGESFASKVSAASIPSVGAVSSVDNKYLISSVNNIIEKGTPISTPEDLNNIRNNLSGKYYLTNDIDLSGYDWIPIGDSTENAFLGTIYGNGYSIKNLTINECNSEDTVFGLFGYVGNDNLSGSQIFFQDLMLSNVSINIESSSSEDILVGAFAGKGYAHWADYSFINCSVSGKITINTLGYAYVGSFIGSGREMRLQSCCNLADISVNSKVSYVGGLLGSCSQAGIENSSNIGNVTSYTKSGRAAVGGLCGEFSGSSGTSGGASIINKSYNSGLIFGQSNNWYAYSGGLVGYVSTFSWYSPSITDCYNSNDVTATTQIPHSELTDSLGAFAGAAIGYLSHGTNCAFSINNYYNIGEVTAKNGSKTNVGCAGNIIGWLFRQTNSSELSINNFYCLNNSLNYYGKSTSEALYPGKIVINNYKKCSIYEMMNQNTYNGFDFKSVWRIENGSNYHLPIHISNFYSEMYKNDETINEERYINEHIVYFNCYRDRWFEVGFSNIVDQSVLKKDAFISRAWDTIKDVGEIASCSFDKLQVTADYYDAYLGDMLLAFSEESANNKKFEYKVGKYYSEGLGSVETFLSSSKEYNNLSDSFKVESAFRPDYDISDAMKKTFSDVYKDAYINNPDKLKNIFQGLDCASEICDDINTGFDAYNTFRECYQAYCISKASKEIYSEFYDFCYDAADELAKKNPKYAGWFRNNIDKFKENSQSDKDLYLNAKVLWEAGYTAYDTFGKKFLTNCSCNIIAGRFNINAGLVGTIIESYNTGVALGELIAPTDTDSVYYMLYVSPVEEAMQTVLGQYGELMKSQRTYATTFKYEIAFTTLKYTNIALYQKTFDFAAKHRILWIKTKSMKENIENATYYKGIWQGFKCHHTESLSELTDKYKAIGICCPVDVYLYKNKELVFSIVNEEIGVFKDSNIAFDICNEKKAVSYPEYNDYEIKIVSRSDGTMDYSILSANGDSVREIETKDISLTADQEFFGLIPQNHNSETENFELTTNSQKISTDFDSFKTLQSVFVDDVYLKCNSSAKIKPIVTADEGLSYTISYESSDPSIAIVDTYGNITGIKNGSSIITCTVTDEVGRSVKGTCIATVIYNVIFGDVNDDGRYDGQDAVVVNCLANGLLTKEQVGEANYFAADCNRDGQITQSDVDLLMYAGVYKYEVRQEADANPLKVDILFANEFDFDSFGFSYSCYGGQIEDIDYENNSVIIMSESDDCFMNPWYGADNSMKLIPGHKYRIKYMAENLSDSLAKPYILLFARNLEESTDIDNIEYMLTELDAGQKTVFEDYYIVPEGCPFVKVRLGNGAPSTVRISDILIQDITNEFNTDDTLSLPEFEGEECSTLTINKGIAYSDYCSSLPMINASECYLEGWYTEKDSNGNGTGERFNCDKAIKSNIKLYPRWERNPTITFDNEFDFSNYLFDSVSRGNLIVSNFDSSVEISSTGYDCYTIPYNITSQPGFMLLEPGKTYRFTYNYENKSDSSNTISLLIFAFQNVTSDDYEFKYLYSNIEANECGEKTIIYTVPEDRPYTTIRFGVSNENTIVKFSDLYVQNITNSDGIADDINEPIHMISVPYDKTITEAESITSLPVLSRTGYEFMGWYTGKNGTGTRFTDSTVVTESVRLYSYWVK